MFLSHFSHACLFLVSLHSSSRIPRYLLYGACQQTALMVSAGCVSRQKRPLCTTIYIAMAAGPYMRIYIHHACIQYIYVQYIPVQTVLLSAHTSVRAVFFFEDNVCKLRACTRWPHNQFYMHCVCVVTTDIFLFFPPRLVL